MWWGTDPDRMEMGPEWHMDSKDTRLDSIARPLAREDSPALPSAREKNSDGIPPKVGKRTSNGGRESKANAWPGTKPVVYTREEFERDRHGETGESYQ